FVISTQEPSSADGHARTESLGSDVFSNAPFSVATGNQLDLENPPDTDEFGSTPFTEVPSDKTADLPQEEASHDPFDLAPFNPHIGGSQDTDLFGCAPFVPPVESTENGEGKLHRQPAVRYHHHSGGGARTINATTARGLREQKEACRRSRQRRMSRSSSNSSSGGGGGGGRRSKVKDVNKKNVDQPQKPNKDSDSTDLFGFSPFKPGSRSDCEVPVQ
uniref:Uncharacterized protein n=1 Tax=Ciona savignyi TaxID=51511 RepID=H2Z8S4_CIOSA